MAWEHRGSTQKYYYRSRKKQGRVVRQYYGRGNLAERVAAEDEQKRVLREKQRTEQQHIQALNTETQSLCQHMTTLVKAAFIAAGFHQHKRSEWRKRRTHITQGDNMNTTVPVVQENLSIETLTSLIGKAVSGDESSLQAIQTMLHPVLFQQVFSITKKVETAWIQTIAGKDLITKEVLTQQVDSIKRTLEAESTSPLEFLIIETISTAWLAYKQAELSVAERLRSGIPLTQAQENHLTACQKRYLSTIKELARIRQLLAPRNTTVLNIANQQQVNLS